MPLDGVVATLPAMTPPVSRPSCLLGALILVLHLPAALAAPVTRRVHGEGVGGDVVVACDAGPFAADYKAETASGVPLNGPYARARGADKGLVHLMSQGGRATKAYIVPRRLIRAIVRVDEVDSPNHVDLVFTGRDLRVIHSWNANAGIFTVSDVWRLRVGRGGHVDTAPLRDDEEVQRSAELGLAAYQPGAGVCAP